MVVSFLARLARVGETKRVAAKIRASDVDVTIANSMLAIRRNRYYDNVDEISNPCLMILSVGHRVCCANLACNKWPAGHLPVTSAKNTQISNKSTTNEQQINNTSTTIESQVHNEPATRQIDTTAILDVLR